jgi:multiple antibiotic resistance protein
MQLYLFAFAALISVINPLGTLPIFIGLTKEKESKEIRMISLLTVINMFVILMISFYTGEYILQFFGISLNSLKIAGGFIIASSGFALLTGNFTKHKGMKKREKDDAFQRSDISLTPLAIPMLAGPGTISLLIGYQLDYALFSDKISIVLAIFSVCLATFTCLISSKVIIKTLGASGINALSRIIGFIVIAIGVEYIMGVILELLNK